MTDSGYHRTAYSKQADNLRATARAVVPVILGQVNAASVADVGCGTGVWLATFQEFGVGEIFGTDLHSELDLMQIAPEFYRPHDLRQPLQVDRRFDLAICIEVAEHVPAESAETLVDSLVGLADVVLLSAAIPGQGGRRHINEQWPAYWAEKMLQRGYFAFDTLRPALWTEPNVQHWVAQNAILYANARGIASNPRLGRAFSFGNGMPPALVHPTQLKNVRQRLGQDKRKSRNQAVNGQRPNRKVVRASGMGAESESAG